MKKISLLFLCFVLVFSSIPVSSVEPRWTNTQWVILYHENVEGDAHCEVEIQGFSGTTRIDNVDIELYISYNGYWIIVQRWEDLYVNGSEFYFYDTVEKVHSGYTYRMIMTADVHRNGTVESLNLYHDTDY